MKLFNDDCLNILKTLPENSIDALVTDPPAGISFMGKSWDSDKGGRDAWISWMTEVMSETIRVLKPGAHGLVWAIPRTSHWTATALENAGFEVRDVITHLFGSGFPKSLDISKAIDKAAKVEREIISENINVRGRQNKGFAGGDYANSKRENSKCLKDASKNVSVITAPKTQNAKQWEGWGTALKPASEHWILVRKPLSEKTVAANVLKWGVGGLNIDGCRIRVSPEYPNHRKASVPFTSKGYTAGVGGLHGRPTENLDAKGRFPANLVFSHTPYCTEEQCDIECAIKMLDEQSGNVKSAGVYKAEKTERGFSNTGMFKAGYTSNRYTGEQGGASRFFYCAKVSTRERNEGAEENKHPTVKSQKLMGYLIKLVTPPNGIVLDPFMGSGSTGCAAIKEGFDFIGIEKEHEYFETANARLLHALSENL